jgi:hypothetical protein
MTQPLTVAFWRGARGVLSDADVDVDVYDDVAALPASPFDVRSSADADNNLIANPVTPDNVAG